jgi:hypothetical protein
MVTTQWHMENARCHQAKEIAMKRLLIFSVLSAFLSGCVVVPAGDYYRGHGYYRGDGYDRSYGYYRGDGYYRGRDDRGYWGYGYRDHGG